MTREEAINVLNDYDINFERNTAEEIAEAHEIATQALEQQANIEQIIKTTIKEYIDKDCDDVTELLLALSKDLCERIRKEN